MSLAELFQNALKHNTVAPDLRCPSASRVEDTTLIFENKLRSRTEAGALDRNRPAPLGERFRIATGRAAVWDDEADRFVVRLPLVESSTGAPRPNNL